MEGTFHRALILGILGVFYAIGIPTCVYEACIVEYPVQNQCTEENPIESLIEQSIKQVSEHVWRLELTVGDPCHRSGRYHQSTYPANLELLIQRLEKDNQKIVSTEHFPLSHYLVVTQTQ